MAGPGGREVGRVSVRVLPNTSNFGASLKKYLERIERTLRIELPVSLDNATVAETEARLEYLTRDRKVEIKTDLDTTPLDQIGKSFDKIGGSFGGFQRGMRAGPLILVGAILALLPLIGVAIAALPGILFTLLAPIGAILLGLDGIKKAAEVLAKPFEKMRDEVSKAFERGLTPVFKNFAKVMEPVTDGMVLLVEAMSLMADHVVKRLSSKQGLEQISKIFENIAEALTILAPSMGPLTDSFLLLIERGTEAFIPFAEGMADMIEWFNRVLIWLDENGALMAAFHTFANFLLFLSAILAGLVLGGIMFLAAIAWLQQKLAELTMSIAGWAEGVTGTIQALPGRVWSALSSLPAIIGSVFQGAMQKAYNAVSRVGEEVFRWFRQLPGKIIGAVGDLGMTLYNAGKSVISGLAKGIKDAANTTLKKALSAVTAAIPVWKGPPERDKVLLFENGQMIMDSLVDGFQSRMGNVKMSLSNFTDDLAGAGESDGEGGPLPVVIVNWNDGRQMIDSRAQSQISRTSFADTVAVMY